MKASNQRKWMGMGLLLFVVITGAYLATGGGDVEDPPFGLEINVAQATSAQALGSADASLVDMQQASKETLGQREVVEEVTVEERTTFSPRASSKSVIWIDGVVESVEGTPIDETMEVVAKGKIFAGTKDRKEHRVPVAADGRFRVAVSVDTAAARLSLVGKYQYLKEPVVWLKSKGGEAILKPILGAHVSVQVVAEPMAMEGFKDFSAKLQGLSRWQGDVSPQLLGGNRLLLSAVPAARQFRLFVKANGYASFSLDLKGLEEGESAERTVVLKPEAIVTGRIVDNRGEPVPSGRIAPRLAGENRWDTTLGANTFVHVTGGTFELRGLPAGEIALSYSGTGYSAEQLTVPNLRTGEHRDGLVWHANKGLSVHGKVVWADGTPARHVSVKLVGMSQRELAVAKGGGGNWSGPTSSKTETDADGLFEISGFSKPIQVELMADGLPPDKRIPRDLSKIKTRRFIRKHTVRARVENVLVGGPAVSILLGEEQEPLRGRVEDDLGNPIKTFRIAATPVKGRGPVKKKSGWGTTKGGVLRQRYQDDDGAFEWAGIPGGDWSLGATASGYQVGELQSVTLPSNKQVVFMLPRGARIFGKVVDQEDEKVLAEVRYSAIIDGVVSDSSNSVAATKQFGFSIPNLAPGTYSVYANEPLAGASPKQVFQVAAGEIVEDVVLKLPGSGRVEGTVHSDWWQPELAVSIRVVPSDGNRWTPSNSATVNGDGSFLAPELAPGEYTAKLQGQFTVSGGKTLNSDPGQSKTFQVVSGQTSTVFFGPAAPGSVRLKGKLLRDGEGVSGYRLDLTGVKPARNRVESISRAGGAYSMILGGAGEYRVRARPSDGGPAQVWRLTVGAGGNQNLDLLLPSASLTVAMSAQGGATLPFDLKASQWTVEVDGLGSRGSIQAKRIEGHEVTFEGLAPGEYRLVYRSRRNAWGGSNDSQDSPDAWILEQANDIVLAPGEQHRNVRRNMRLGASLTGRIVGSPNDPDLFLYVSVTPEGGGKTAKFGRVKEGAFSISGLTVGKYEVTCNGSGLDETEPVSVQVTLESPAHVELPYPQDSED